MAEAHRADRRKTRTTTKVDSEVGTLRYIPTGGFNVDLTCHFDVYASHWTWLSLYAWTYFTYTIAHVYVDVYIR